MKTHRLLPGALALALLLACGCREEERAAMISAGWERRAVRGMLEARGATKINDLVALQMDKTQDWWVDGEGTVLLFVYDNDLVLQNVYSWDLHIKTSQHRPYCAYNGSTRSKSSSTQLMTGLIDVSLFVT